MLYCPKDNKALLIKEIKPNVIFIGFVQLNIFLLNHSNFLNQLVNKNMINPNSFHLSEVELL